MNLILIASEETFIYNTFLTKEMNIVELHNYNLFEENIFELEYSFNVVLIDNYHLKSSVKKSQRISRLYNEKFNNENQSILYVFTQDLLLYKKINEMEDRIKAVYVNGELTKEMILKYVKVKVSKKFSTSTKDKKRNTLPTEKLIVPAQIDKPEPKQSLLSRFKRKKVTEDTYDDRAIEKQLDRLGKGVSKTIAVTGNSGSGITSTAINLGQQASKQGLSTIIVDLDTRYRSFNMYFEQFNNETKVNSDINSSLIKMLAKPNDYMINSYSINNNLWMTGLGYEFDDRKLLERFLEINNLIGMITLLKTKFNVVILDMPMDVYQQFKEVRIHIDLFAICVENNLYSILNTIRNVDVSMTQDEAKYFNTKSKLVINKYDPAVTYNGEFLTDEVVSEILSSGISDKLVYKIPIAGIIHHDHDFHKQIEKDSAAVTTNQKIAKEFDLLLLRLLENA